MLEEGLFQHDTCSTNAPSLCSDPRLVHLWLHQYLPSRDTEEKGFGGLCCIQPLSTAADCRHLLWLTSVQII